MIDLIKRLAVLRGEDPGADPDSWFRRTFSIEPNYSDVLDRLTGTPAERSRILRAYFEPTAEEIAQGQKLPTEAHRRIAELVSKGYVRVIITTNFDRLTEQALAQFGIGPSVIASPDAATGAMSLTHSPCTIIKVNGDYLDTRFKNTTTELSEYDPAINRLLDQVFDEYGLVVCGWSSEWDPALRSALERCSTRRFSTYWTLLTGSSPSDMAARLIAHRCASVIQITDADTFFGDIAENVSSLEALTTSDPLSGDVMVTKLKRYLADDIHRIPLRDLFLAEVSRTQTFIMGDQFSLNEPGSREINGVRMIERVKKYDAATSALLRLLSVISFWASDDRYSLLTDCMRRITDIPSNVSGLNVWISLRWYPATLAFHAIGIAALAAKQISLLAKLLTFRIDHDNDRPSILAASFLNDDLCLARRIQRELPGCERHYTPVLNHMLEVLQMGLRDLQLEAKEIDDLLDQFDYIRCMVAWDIECPRTLLKTLEERGESLPLSRTPLGRFFWKSSFFSKNGLCSKMTIEKGQPIPWLPGQLLEAGLFESAGQSHVNDKYLLAKNAVDQAASRHRF